MFPMIRFFYLEAKFRIGDHRERDDPPSGLAWPEWLVSTRKCLDFTLTAFYLIRCCVLAVNQHPESLAKLARYDPLACVIEQTHFDPFSMVAMVLLMIYSIISQIILFTSDKTKVAWQVVYDVTVRLTDLYNSEPYATKDDHNLVASFRRESATPSIGSQWYVEHLPSSTRHGIQPQYRRQFKKKLKWIANSRYLYYLDTFFPQFCGYTRLVNFALSEKRLRHFPNLSVTTKFLLMMMLSALEAFYQLVTGIFVFICIYSLYYAWIEFRIYFPIYYTPLMMLDFILTCYTIYVLVVPCSLYVIFSCLMIVYAYIWQLRQLNLYIGTAVRRNFTSATYLRVLRHFNLEHTRLVYYILFADHQLVSLYLFLLASTITPVNIIFLDILYFTKQLAPGIRRLFVFAVFGQAFFTGMSLFPMMYMAFQMHNSRKYFIPLQLKLPSNQLSAKLKTMILYERIESEEKLTFTVGPINTVTEKSFIDFIRAYFSYLLLAGSFMMANKY